MTSAPEISGLCPPRFHAVKDAFAANFTDAPDGLNEQGARFSVVIAGETVLDLWAGVAEPRDQTPFTEDTLVPVFSSGKAIMALLMASAVQRGKLAYEEKVAHVWPEYGANGKADVSIAQLLSHQDGLPGFSEPVDPAIWFDQRAVLDKLAAQAPMWPPGTASGYHPVTVGFLANEVHHLADGRTMGQALRQDFAQPLGLDLWIGLPETEHGRVAALKKPSKAPDLGAIDAIKTAAFLDKGSAPGGRGSAEWRSIEIPSANLHGTALALARAMGVFANDGWLEGRSVLSPPVLAEATKARISGPDKVLPYDITWAAGLMRNAGLNIFGPNPDALGHCGWGGSCVMGDPDVKLSAAYAMTRQSPYLIGDPRAQRLIEALYSAF